MPDGVRRFGPVLPYFEFPTIQLGPIPLHVFGLMVAAGVLVGTKLAVRAVERTTNAETAHALNDAAFWALVGGIVGAHLLHVLGYHPEMLRQDGWLVLLKVWDGLSSMGGLVGGIAGIAYSLRRQGRAFGPYLNGLALGTAPGWAVARIGCIAVHDHPGVLTDFPLAFAYPGGARHDLGFYDFLVLAALSALLYILARKPRPEGFLAGVLAVGYCIPRFLLDFLRARDVPNADGRIFGLTPAQYICAVLVPVGLWLLVRRKDVQPQAAHLPASPQVH